MRTVKSFVLTNTPNDKFGNPIAFAIDPETGTSYFINTQMVEQFALTEEKHGMTFDGYATEPVIERGDKGGRILYILPNTMSMAHIVATAPATSQYAPEDSVDEAEVVEMLEGLRAEAMAAVEAARTALNVAVSLLEKIDYELSEPDDTDD